MCLLPKYSDAIKRMIFQKKQDSNRQGKIDYFILRNEICVVNLLILIRYDPMEKTSSGVSENIRQCLKRNSTLSCSGEINAVVFLVIKNILFSFVFDLLFWSADVRLKRNA